MNEFPTTTPEPPRSGPARAPLRRERHLPAGSTRSPSATTTWKSGTRSGWARRRATSIRATPTPRYARSKRDPHHGRRRGSHQLDRHGGDQQYLFALLAPGDRVVAIKDTYGGSNKIFIVPAAPQCRCVHGRHQRFRGHRARSQEGLQGALSRDPDQPTPKIVDIERLAKVAHENGAIVVVDNTFATPINQRPISLGATSSFTAPRKYPNGHSDVMGGLAVGKKDLIDQIFHYREITGATLHPQSAYMILRGMKTLELRIARHNENAAKVATFLSQHPVVDQVFYPGLRNPPQPRHRHARCAASAAC